MLNMSRLSFWAALRFGIDLLWARMLDVGLWSNWTVLLENLASRQVRWLLGDSIRRCGFELVGVVMAGGLSGARVLLGVSVHRVTRLVFSEMKQVRVLAVMM